MAHKGELVEVETELGTFDVTLESMTDVAQEPGWECHDELGNKFYLQWDGQVRRSGIVIGHAPTWVALLKSMIEQ